MKYKIIHDTSYEFNDEVFLEPHYFRFQPRNSPTHQTEKFSISVHPKPAGLVEQIDAENNCIHFCWFDGMTRTFKIKSESIVSALSTNPLSSILYPSFFNTVPFEYSVQEKEILSPSLNKMPISEALVAYGKKIMQGSESNTIPFIMNLTRRLHEDFTIESREIGEPMHPNETFEQKIGACRDLSWMQIHLLRNIGIAARFVSGYFYMDNENPEYELHGWTEVYLPGMGWIGSDPSNGILTTASHIPICSSAQFFNTMPVSGTTRGSALGELKTNLRIELMGE